MFRRAASACLLLVVGLAAAPAGAPVQLSYVYSDSMEPTIGVDDGYVLVPAGDVETGDVVTFRSREREEFVTHRVVGETTDGFVTKGDNNPTTDQASGAPPVTRAQIRGEVLTVGGEPLVIPSLGLAIAFLRANVAGLVAAAVGALGLALFGGSGGRPRREVTRVRDFATPVVLTAAAACIGMLAYGGASHDVTMVAVDSAAAASSPTTTLVGSPERVSFAVNESASPLTTRVVSLDGASVTGVTRTAENVTVTGRVPPPSDIGPVPVTVRAAQYPSVLPASVLDWLARIHPVAAATATVSVLFAPFGAAYVALFDGATPVRASRSRLWRLLTGESE